MRSIAALSAAAVFLFAATARAQLSISSLNTSFKIDFDSTVAGVENDVYTAAGLQPTPSAGQIDSDAWSISLAPGSSTNFLGSNSASYARGTSTGGISVPGVYAFDIDPTAAVNTALGFQPDTNNFAPGSVTLRIQNNTTKILNSLTVAYKVFVRNDQGRSSTVRFSSGSD